MNGINLLHHALRGVEGKRILDLGVGGGAHAKAFIGCGAEVVGVDVKDAPHEHERYTHSQMPIEFLELADDAKPYDIVWSCHTLQHLPNVQAALVQMADFLAEDGWLYIAIPSASQDRLQTLVYQPKAG